MQPPPLPTDSLYKFMALAGLVVMIAVPLYTLSKMWEIQPQVAELKARVDSAPPSAALENIEEKLQAIEELTEYRVSAARLRVRIDQFGFLIALSTVSFVAGGALAVFGFYLWYVRVQQYLDRALQRGAVYASQPDDDASKS